jgi:hypothetical protein
MDISNSSDSVETIVGYVAGVANKRPRDIVEGLEGSGINITVQDIEELGLPPSEFFEDVEQGMDWLHDLVYGSLETSTALTMGIAGLIFNDEGGPPTAEEQAKAKEAEEPLLDAIDELEATGGLGKGEANQLRQITQGYRPNRIQEVFDWLHEAANKPEQRALREEFDLVPGEWFKKMDEDELSEMQTAFRLRLEGKGLAVPMGQGATQQVPNQPGQPLTRNQILYPDEYVLGEQDDFSTFESGELNFRQYLYSTGTMLPGEQVEAPEPRPLASSGFFEESFTIDPSSYNPVTGAARTFSDEEWELLQTDPVARAKYAASKIVTPAIEEILSRPQFAGQVDEFRTINYQDADGNWKTRRIPMYSDVGGINPGSQIQQIPIEDLGIPTPVKGFRNPDGSWNAGYPWETQRPLYRAGDGYAQWIAFTPRQRQMRLKMMVDEGLLTNAEIEAMTGAVTRDHISGGSPLNLTAGAIWEQSIGLSRETGFSPIQSLRAIGEANRVQQARNQPRSYGGGRSAPKYSVPASLRTIPDYEALAQESKGIFRQTMGRDLEDWELTILSDELKDKYEQRNREMIVAHKAAWDDAVAGGSTEVDFTEVTEPTAAIEYDIEERYANELDRQERVQDQATNRRVLMDSIAIGQRMI